MDQYLKILQQYWGYPDFRPLQHDIIRSVGEGHDTLALMPTGGGKSITFQVPALAKEGICIVVTPLIALMKDQVENLKERKIKAAAIYTGMTRHEIDITLENCVFDKDLKFLYCSPERLSTEIFKERVKQMNVNLLAIDESHCISQWGYDFRPSYLRIADIRELMPDTPVLAVTATATPAVVDDIQERLGFKEKNVFQKSFERKNLVYLIRETEDKEKYLLRIAEAIKGSGVVYVRSRAKTKEIAQLLLSKGIQASYYHAGLSSAERDHKQREWKNGQVRIVVATNAFGMGIDKADVRFVVHVDLPDTLEAYFQEAGRGGRDEKQAFAILLYHKSDKLKLERRIVTSYPELGEVKRVYEALGNFFQIPLGAGKGMSYDFDMAKFIKAYRLSVLQAYNGIKMLQQSGYLEMSEEVDNPSRILFLVQRDDLYKYQVKNAAEDTFIKLLLRSYSGMFTEYRGIDEEDLARKAGVKPEVIYNYLIKLSRDKIITFIPRKKVPQIFYSEERLAPQSLVFSKENYFDRKEQFEKRIHAVIEYVTQSKCRSQQLLSYFGQKDARPCGVCDVCTKKNDVDLPQVVFDEIQERVQQILQEQVMDIETLVDKLGGSPEKNVKVIQWLLDHDKVVKNVAQKLKWNI